MEPRGEPVLTATGVRRAFGATLALRGVDLPLRAGEVHALLGENGAGKSTLVAEAANRDRAVAPGGAVEVECSS